jgi:O-antigen/teichoic acid export membrane protein
VYRFWTLGGVFLLAVLDRSGTISPAGFLMVFGIITLGHCLRMVMGVTLVRRRLGWGRLAFDRSVAVYLLKQMWIMGIATFCTGLSLRVDIFILKLLKGPEAVSMFHLPHIFVLQSQVVAVALVTAVFPVFSRWSDSVRRHEFMEIRDTTVRVLSVIGFSIALGSSFFAPVIIRILGGGRFPEAEAVLTVLSWCVPILFLNFLGANLLTTLKRQTFLIYGAVLSLVMNIWLDLLWVPRYGPLGAAWGTLVSYGCQLLVIYMFLRKSDTHPFRAVKLLGGVAVISLSVLAIGFRIAPDNDLQYPVKFFLFAFATWLIYRIQPNRWRERFFELILRRRIGGDHPIENKKHFDV